jgi:2-(3-amino-3-carboxypropyl)histidine synthase
LFLSKKALQEKGFEKIVIPQEKPRSSGEVLGCTSPRFESSKEHRNIVIFLCDGRFHMEATMIANPTFEFYQYNPYNREFTE